MALITRDEVKEFLGISTAETSFDTEIARNIPVVTDRLRFLCHQAFTVQPLRQAVFSRVFMRPPEYHFARDESLYILPQVDCTFDGSVMTVTAKDENFASAQFAAGQDIFIKGSYLNDGYYEVSTVSTSVLTIATSYSFTGAATGTHSFDDEATGASVYIAVVKWPEGIKPVAASLIQYEYQDRGGWAEDSQSGHGEYGYPVELLRPLMPFTKPRYGGMIY